MKKRLLFVIPSLCEGGAEKSLLTLLSLMDYEKYEVDLFAFNPTGMLAEMLPENVNVLNLPKDYITSRLPLIKSFFTFALRGKFKLAFYRFRYSQILRKYSYTNKAEQYAWKYLTKFLPVFDNKYSVAIGYLEKTPNYFIVDNVRAKSKIAYIHSDYEKLEVDADFDNRYFAKINWVVTVSKVCAESLIKIIPAIKSKTTVIENIILKEEIERLSMSSPLFEGEFAGKILLTVGRISREKGIDLAVEACKTLLVDGWQVRWYHIGTGDLQEEIQSMIDANGLKNSFILLGKKKNPYKYMAQCDIYVQPSRFEGKSIAIEETKALAKPIVATRFSTVVNQIEDGITGFIAD
ncbi:MAG: glycosyltransferase, partial [Eubacteriales bacterium]